MLELSQDSHQANRQVNYVTAYKIEKKNRENILSMPIICQAFSHYHIQFSPSIALLDKNHYLQFMEDQIKSP